MVTAEAFDKHIRLAEEKGYDEVFLLQKIVNRVSLRRDWL